MEQSKLLTSVPRVVAIVRYCILRASLFTVSSARAALANPQVLAVILVILGAANIGLINNNDIIRDNPGTYSPTSFALSCQSQFQVAKRGGI